MDKIFHLKMFRAFLAVYLLFTCRPLFATNACIKVFKLDLSPLERLELEDHQKRITAENEIREIFPDFFIEYLGQGGEGVVFKSPQGKNRPLIIKRFKHESMLEMNDEVLGFLRQIHVDGLAVVQLQKVNDTSIALYRDPPGEPLTSFSENVFVQEKFRELAGRVLLAVKEKYEVLDVKFTDHLSIDTWSIRFKVSTGDGFGIGSISFKPSNYKYDPSTEIFHLYDPL